LIVRLYESAGGRCSFNLKTSLPVKSAALCNMLEHELAEKSKLNCEKGFIHISIQPFQILTVKLVLH